MQNDSSPLISLALIDWIIIAAYGVFLFGVAIWAFRKIKDCGGYLAGSRKMGNLTIMASAFAGGTNANHPLSVSAAAYQYGMPGIWLSLTWILMTPFYWLYPPVIRRLRVLTAVDMVRMRFGPTMGFLMNSKNLILVPIAVSLGIKSGAIVLEVMTGGAISGFWAIAAITVPTLIYTLLGGVIAAYVTDVYQGVLIIVLSFLLIPFAIHESGGIAQLDANIGDEFTSLFSGVSAEFGPWWIFWFAVGIIFSAATQSIAGASASRNEMTARMKTVGMVAKRFCTVGWGLIGVIGMALFAGHPMLDEASGVVGASPDNIFPLAAGELLPVALRGLMVASILAAVMSSLDAAILVFGGTMVNNIYEEYFAKGRSPGHYLAAARIFSVLGMAIGVYIATTIDDLVEFTTIVEPLGAILGIALLVGIFWRRATRAGAIASVLIVTPLFIAANRPDWPNWEWLTTLTGGPFSLFEWLQLKPVALWLADWYGLNLADPALGYMNAQGELTGLPVQIKIPIYIIPALLSIIGVSLFTRQHDQHAVDEFFCRMDTPVGKEHKIRAAGFEVDRLEHLDKEDITFTEEDDQRDERLLIPDLFYLPKLLRSGEVKLSDYKNDLLGLAGTIVFVACFLYGVELFGRLL